MTGSQHEAPLATPVVLPASTARKLIAIKAFLTPLALVQEADRDVHGIAPTGGTGSREGTRVPFRAHQRIDTPWDGLAGARTPDGIRAELNAWATTMHPGWETEGEDAFTWVAANAEHLARTFPDWPEFTQEVVTLHWRLEHMLGYQAWEQTDWRCGSCRNYLSRHRSDLGLSDQLWCTPCDVFYADLDDMWEQLRARLLNSPDTVTRDAWLTRTQVLTLWPSLKADTLKHWRHRGKVLTREDGKYQLHSVIEAVRSLDTR